MILLVQLQFAVRAYVEKGEGMSEELLFCSRFFPKSCGFGSHFSSECPSSRSKVTYF